MAHHELDVKGLNCPLPIMQAKKIMKSLEDGDTLEVLATDPGSVEDFASFCRATDNTLLEQDEDDGVYRFLLKKS
jgi:tRNA 2-thiouridine synthesizing protein A